MTAPNTLIVVLTEPLSVVLADSEDPSTLLLGSKQFADSGLGKLVGFYDWLHSAEGKLIGVRTRTFSDPRIADLRRRLGANEAVELHEPNVHIYFSVQREFDESLSYDLEYGTNRILMAPDGTLALTFDTVHLSEAELSTLRALTRMHD